MWSVGECGLGSVGWGVWLVECSWGARNALCKAVKWLSLCCFLRCVSHASKALQLPARFDAVVLAELGRHEGSAAHAQLGYILRLTRLTDPAGPVEPTGPTPARFGMCECVARVNRCLFMGCMHCVCTWCTCTHP